jgi:membrane protease YdiL (CAAX protease family)
MLLGALFGYLYVWSGNLFIPVLAHFVNNGFTVSMMYLYNQGQISTDIENVEQVPWEIAIFSGLVSGLLLFTFYRLNSKTPPA